MGRVAIDYFCEKTPPSSGETIAKTSFLGGVAHPVAAYGGWRPAFAPKAP